MNDINIKDRKVKIVATIGPATRSLEMIEKIMLAGVNVFRLNFSHGDHKDHKESFDNIKEISKKLNIPISIFADMQGPKLRVGRFKDEKVYLEKYQKFTLDLNPELGDNNRVCLPHSQIFEALKEGDYLLVDDGKIRLKVEKFGKDFAETKVIVGGTISNYKGVNFPSGVLKLSSLTEKDLKDLDYSLSLGVDYIALSFVQLASDVEYAKSIINGRAKVISKIEKPSAIDNLKDIVEASDVIMIARGDLGVEIPTERVPVIQKQIIKECRYQATPVIVATQMLDSMTHSPIPTRAEASDVANAVYDGADAVMLSGETTVGEYPDITVSTMAHIINNVERDPHYWSLVNDSCREIDKYYQKNITIGKSISTAVRKISNNLNAKVVVTFSSFGTTSNRISHNRAKAKILTVTNNKKLYGQLMLSWGVTPLLFEEITSFSEVAELSTNWLKENKWVEKGDNILIVAGIPLSEGGTTNTIRVIQID